MSSSSPIYPARAVPPVSPCARHRLRQRTYQGIPSIAVLPGGLFFACAYSGGDGECQQNYVFLMVSRDYGRRWSDAVAVVDPPQKDVRAFDPVVWVSPQGELCLFWSQSYCAEYAGGVFDGVGGVWMSKLCNPREPASRFRFTAPVRLTHGIMLNPPLVVGRGKTWLMPCSVWNMYTTRPDGMASYRGAGCWASTDQGKTARFRGRVVIQNESTFDEHHFVLRRDGRLWCVMRARTRAKESFSQDGGRTWTLPRDVDFCGFSRIALLRLASGNLLRVDNTPGDGSCRRNNLTAYLSLDDGETWPHRLLLDERDNVSYPCAAQDETGRIHVIYDHERAHGEILLASFREEDLLAGAPCSADFRLRHFVSATSIHPSFPTIDNHQRNNHEKT